MGRPRWKRGLTVLLAAAAVGVLIVAAATDLQAHARTRHERQILTAADANLAHARGTLAAASGSLRSANAQAVRLQAETAITLGAASADEQSLTSTSQAAYLQGLDIGTLQACLGGVRSALLSIANHSNAQAGTDLSAVSGPCLTLAGGNQSGLVYPFDFPDPFVLAVDGVYYAYATNSAEGNIQIIESSDLVHWTAVGNALPKLPSWASPNANDTWAPAVLPIGGQFVLYYSAVQTGDGAECISSATAAQPQGPFVDSSSAPMVCQPSLGGSIDPSPFVDTDGTPYLVWKSNGLNGQPPMIWSQQLNPTGTALTGSGATALLEPTEAWENGVVEAPDLFWDAGHYDLFYSGNNWNSANYAVGVATCSGPLGPCTNLSAQPILASGPDLSGPGGESVFVAYSGAVWIAFHAWAPGAVGYPHSRELYLRPLDLSGPLPVVEPAG
ncbi:MAG: glycoside hydrolase family 43 protein [Acidimicrobiales bacterium]